MPSHTYTADMERLARAIARRARLAPEAFINTLHYAAYRRYLRPKIKVLDRIYYSSEYVVVFTRGDCEWDCRHVYVIGRDSQSGRLFINYRGYDAGMRDNALASAAQDVRTIKAAAGEVEIARVPDKVVKERIFGYHVDVPDEAEVVIEPESDKTYRLQGDLAATIVAVYDDNEALIDDYTREARNNARVELRLVLKAIIARRLQAWLARHGVSVDIDPRNLTLRVRGAAMGRLVPTVYRRVSALCHMVTDALRHIMGLPTYCDWVDEDRFAATHAMEVRQLKQPFDPTVAQILLGMDETESIHITINELAIDDSELGKVLEELARAVGAQARNTQPMRETIMVGDHAVTVTTLPRRLTVTVQRGLAPDALPADTAVNIDVGPFFVPAGGEITVTHPEHGRKTIILRKPAVILRFHSLLTIEHIEMMNRLALTLAAEG